MRNMQVEPLTPSIGAEIHGVDLASNLTDDEVGAIRDALLTHLVVFFRDQQLDARSLDTLGRRFGEPHTHYAAPEGVEGFQSIIPVHADADTRANNGGGMALGQLLRQSASHGEHNAFAYRPRVRRRHPVG